MYNNSANTQFTGKSILFLPSCHSTNTLAIEKVKSGDAANGLIIITHEQTSGRGQRGNTWLSEAGANLTLSVIYLPDTLKVRDAFYLNIIASLAIADTLQHFLPGKDIRVKWPNDVYCGEKKLCGILIENSIRQQFISSVVIGIGLNVNQHISGLPNAGSMIQECGEAFDLEQVFYFLVENIERYYLLFQGDSKDILFRLYVEKLYWLGQTRTFKDSEGVFTGIIQGITESGRLIVDKENHTKFQYAFKEIEYLH
ncbi:MAG: biotin--[acetyl-CoA-carboxylase] ligase [Cytophagales bacterium]|nr:biotin--[acetyl-CoA-carboxylase] ligase [Cytophaga sp.]